MKRRIFLSLSAVAAATILIGQNFIPSSRINASDFKFKLPIPIFWEKFYLEELKENSAFAKFNVSKKATTITKTPKVLTKLEKYPPQSVANTRSFTLSAGMGTLYINNKSMSMDRIDEIVPVNQTKVWEVYNQGMMMGQFIVSKNQERI
jgi:FtsP/CotA-like multicopper oxidase with cupredoxin domain